MHMTIKMLEGEVWYGPSSKHGQQMPHDKNSVYYVDIETNSTGNQDNPLLISNMGRFIYAPRGFTLEIREGVIEADSRFGEIDFAEGFGTLKEAFLEAMRRYFPPNGEIPPEEFFTIPQYNTWIELIYDQTQERVMTYAHGIIDNGMPAGIIMVDDGWNDYYGSFRFSKEKFPDAKAMTDELHRMGFKIMMWICPFISPDSPEARYLHERGMLVRRNDRKYAVEESPMAVRQWWNGWSAVLDMTNPETEAWLDEKLRVLMDEYGVDGFKLDAGDAMYYFEDDVTHVPVTPTEHEALWNKFGAKYAFNEFRACFRCAGLPLVQRLHDKAHAWEHGVAALVPDTVTQSILGYAYVCPDMIGGGSFVDFLPGSTTFDDELLIRYCEAAALMPMMQFSLAPWRVLDKEKYDIILKMSDLHVEFAPKIIALAKEAAKTGEPIVRSLEYCFPHNGFEKCFDCFMLGDDVLVAPVCEKGATVRTLRLPEGEWMDDCGVVHVGGGEVTVDAPLDRLPYFKKI